MTYPNYKDYSNHLLKCEECFKLHQKILKHMRGEEI